MRKHLQRHTDQAPLAGVDITIAPNGICNCELVGVVAMHGLLSFLFQGCSTLRFRTHVVSVGCSESRLRVLAGSGAQFGSWSISASAFVSQLAPMNHQSDQQRHACRRLNRHPLVGDPEGGVC